MKNTGSVLVVDDNEDVCSFLEAALNGHGFTVFVANSGRAAIKLYRAKPIDIVLMDIGLHDLNGPETLKILQSICPEVPCFFMTASSPLKKEHLGGAIDVFEKPFRNFSEVASIFSEILDKRETIKHPAHPLAETHHEQKSSTTLHDN